MVLLGKYFEINKKLIWKLGISVLLIFAFVSLGLRIDPFEDILIKIGLTLPLIILLGENRFLSILFIPLIFELLNNDNVSAILQFIWLLRLLSLIFIYPLIRNEIRKVIDRTRFKYKEFISSVLALMITWGGFHLFSSIIYVKDFTLMKIFNNFIIYPIVVVVIVMLITKFLSLLNIREKEELC